MVIPRFQSRIVRCCVKGLEVANDSYVEERVEGSYVSSRHVAVMTNTTSSNRMTTETGDDGIDHLRRRMEMVESSQARFPL